MNSKYFERLDENLINQSWQPNASDYAVAIDECNHININFSRLLDNKVCIITGASEGMGNEMARLYVEHGAKLIMTARRKDVLEAAAEKIRRQYPGSEVTPIVADSGKSEDAKMVMDFVMEKYGRLDTLVNNAGIGDQYRIENVPDDIIDKMIDTNLKGPMYYCREALKIMLKQNYGNIVNVSSVNGVRPMCGPAYCSSKAGVNMLTKNIAIRCAGTNIHVNSLCPAFTVTPLALKQERGDKAGGAHQGEDMIPILHSRTLRNMPTFAIDQAMLALFLGSDMSRAITGQVIVCDNGQFQ